MGSSRSWRPKNCSWRCQSKFTATRAEVSWRISRSNVSPFNKRVFALDRHMLAMYIANAQVRKSHPLCWWAGSPFWDLGPADPLLCQLLCRRRPWTWIFWATVIPGQFRDIICMLSLFPFNSVDTDWNFTNSLLHSISHAFKETTRFLSFAALKETYWDNPGVLQKAMTLIAEDLLAFMRKGIPLEDSNLPLRVAVVSIKGDWPWLIEAGALTRHFRRAPKKGESAMVGEGICHLCLAGCDGYPMHEVGDAAKFLATMGSAASLCPWNTLAPWVDLLPASPSFHPYMFRPDLWHNFHLGQGRYWLSSAFVVLLPLFGDGGVEVRFQRMTASWREYCSRKKIRLLAIRLQYFVICWIVSFWVTLVNAIYGNVLAQGPYLTKIARDTMNF